MSEQKKLEEKKVMRSRFQSDRMFHVAGDNVLQPGWHLETREGIKGPFLDRSHAEAFLTRLINRHPRKRIDNWHQAAAG